jgi:hypothetical protein
VGGKFAIPPNNNVVAVEENASDRSGATPLIDTDEPTEQSSALKRIKINATRQSLS